MINDLEGEAKELHDLMSDISEDCWCAGWMDDLEYRLWKMCVGGSREYGQDRVSEAQIQLLRELSKRCGGWIIFHDITEETFVSLREWEELYNEYSANNYEKK